MANLFQWYDPYASVWGAESPQFRGPDGALLPMRCQSDALLGLVVGVCKIFEQPVTRSDWEAYCDLVHGLGVSLWRDLLRKLELDGKLWFMTPSGEPNLTKISAFPDSSVLLTCYELIGRDQEYHPPLLGATCIACLEEVDNALGALRGGVDVEAGIHASIMAAQLFANASALAEGRAIPMTTHAKRGALAKLAVDPKQGAKLKVRECWDEWQKDPNRYKSKAAFARDMLEKFEHLENTRVIERWCKTWEDVSSRQGTDSAS